MIEDRPKYPVITFEEAMEDAGLGYLLEDGGETISLDIGAMKDLQMAIYDMQIRVENGLVPGREGKKWIRRYERALRRVEAGKEPIRARCRLFRISKE